MRVLSLLLPFVALTAFFHDAHGAINSDMSAADARRELQRAQPRNLAAQPKDNGPILDQVRALRSTADDSDVRRTLQQKPPPQPDYRRALQQKPPPQPDYRRVLHEEAYDSPEVMAERVLKAAADSWYKEMRSLDAAAPFSFRHLRDESGGTFGAEA
ncbi:Aste57867_7891 [Aphanomyces stellatus]|uniref:Aste57867_7891 protein n=1 Tax=Aphanomyces stellatus TaxID=120398 RepID=A0A485KIY1_9STRA|nr:hypothetical protein As57867_007861 [Aphanomyces stellatus]VFT84784.1 Aste57867_7891 [Aphanomyces stellatus]